MNVLITGGTGTIGKKLAAKIHKLGHKVFIFSRDEYKQSFMPNYYVKILGDIYHPRQGNLREYAYDIIIHTAACKHVDVMEENLDVNANVNIVGTANMVALARSNKCPIVYLSTDKAVYPINAYGFAKAMGEKYVLNYSRGIVVRYGNVLNSRGSLIEKVWERIKRGDNPLITDHDMTRFWIEQDDVLDFIMKSCESDDYGKVHIPAMNSCNVLSLIRTIQEYAFDKHNFPITNSVKIDIRPGEKIHECLLNRYDKLSNSSRLIYGKNDVYSDDEMTLRSGAGIRQMILRTLENLK